MKNIFVALFIMILGSAMIGGCSSASVPETAAGKPPAHAAAYDKLVGSVAITDTTTSSTMDTTTSTTSDTKSVTTSDTTSDATSDTANEIDSIDYDLYVSVNGNDANSGTKSYPFRTIQKAANVAKPGDRILIGGGTYKEYVNINVSGTAGSPIVFCGERGSNGEYKTIIDPSSDVSTGWVTASEKGAGVYKQKIGFEPDEITIGGKRIGKIRNDYMGTGGEGWKYLAMGANSEVTVLDTGLKVKFWDGIEALYGYDQASVGAGYTYIRFRNGDNPNTKVIKAAKNGSGFYIENKSYITIRDIQVQNCEYSVQMREASHNNIIENCYFRNGGKRVYIFRGANNTIIRNNEMTMDYYAGDSVLGAGNFNSYSLLVKRHVYDTFKYVFGPNHSDDIGIYFRNIGNNTVISGNYIHGGLVGISGYNGDYGFSVPANGVKIFNNKVRNMASVGITSGRNVENMEIYNNLVYDCNLNFRLHELNRTDDVARSVCLYSNVTWNPPDAGVHVFMHFPTSSVPKYFPTYRIYNNVFVGGWDGFNVGSNAVLSGGLPEYSIFNNMMLAVVNIYSYMRTVINNGDIELIDYNVFGGIKYTDLTGVKFGANNVFFAKTYDYLDFETIDQFLTGFDRNIYAIDQMDTPEGLPNCESTWLLR